MAADPDIPNMATAIVAVAFLLGCLMPSCARVNFGIRMPGAPAGAGNGR